MTNRGLKMITVGLAAVALVAVALSVGCGSSTTTKPVPDTLAPTTTAKGATTTATPKTTTTTAKAKTSTAKATTTTVQASDGKALYTKHCIRPTCHSSGVGNVPEADLARIERVIKSGKDNMPAFANKLSATQITAIATYLIWH